MKLTGSINKIEITSSEFEKKTYYFAKLYQGQYYDELRMSAGAFNDFISMGGNQDCTYRITVTSFTRKNDDGKRVTKWVVTGIEK